MQKGSVEAIIAALNRADVRYLVAGGLAVVAHGHVRFTADLDVILDLDEPNVGRALNALSDLGYRPRAPVALAEFADATIRASWVREKGLTVFSLWSDAHTATEIDVFVEAPLEFDAAYARASRMEVSPGVVATFVSFDDLLALKQRAARPQDLQDVGALRRLKEHVDE
ncbi:MAG: nucleotidyl transferase AbiEii/AbiGii toxin family protein [Acidobacteriota bacterium]